MILIFHLQGFPECRGMAGRIVVIRSVITKGEAIASVVESKRYARIYCILYSGWRRT